MLRIAPLTQVLIDMDDSRSTIALEASCLSISRRSVRRRCAGDLSVDQPAKKTKVSKTAEKRLGVQKRAQLQFCSDIDVDCCTWLREMHGAQT